MKRIGIDVGGVIIEKDHGTVDDTSFNSNKLNFVEGSLEAFQNCLILMTFTLFLFVIKNEKLYWVANIASHKKSDTLLVHDRTKLQYARNFNSIISLTTLISCKKLKLQYVKI